MNVRLYDGTARCADHLDASSHAGLTNDPCLYCPPVAYPIAERIHRCSWCGGLADYSIKTAYGDGFACADHAAKHFPRSAKVSLEKVNEFTPWEAETLALSSGGVRPNARPFYPLYTHREGLRRNDLMTLASAIWILALNGGTAHLGPTPGTVGPDGKIVPVNS